MTNQLSNSKVNISFGTKKEILDTVLSINADKEKEHNKKNQLRNKREQSTKGISIVKKAG